MQPGRIANSTHTLRGNGDVGNLRVRVEERHWQGDDGEVYGAIFLCSAWYPTPEELERLNRGAPVILELMEKRAPPPVYVAVGDAPDDSNPYPQKETV